MNKRIERFAPLTMPTSKPDVAADATEPQSERTNVHTENGVSEEESTALRQEKLEVIRAAIAGGAYDSDEMLDKAMKRLLAALDLEQHE